MTTRRTARAGGIAAVYYLAMRTVLRAVVGVFAIVGVVASAERLFGQDVTPLARPLPTHIGIIVHDIEKTARKFEEVFGIKVPPINTSGMTSWADNPAGANVQWRVKLVSFPIGHMTIELVEPLEGPGPHRAFLDKFGQGMHHVAFAVQDRPGTFAFLKGKGATQVSATYTDMKDLLGFTVEVSPMPKQ